MALFNGLGLDRLVDPSAVTDQMVDTTLSFLFDAMGVDPQEADNASEPRSSGRGSNGRFHARLRTAGL